MDLKLITPDEQLETVLAEAKDKINPYRWILITIDHANCKLRMQDVFRKQPPDTWQQEYKEFLLKSLDKLKDKNLPFFLMIHIESEDLQWILIHMTPPNASTRDKMAAASSKATLKNFFGSISKDIFVDSYEDLDVKKIEEQISVDKKQLREMVSTAQELEQARQEEQEVLHRIEQCNYSQAGTALNSYLLLDYDSIYELEKFLRDELAFMRFEMSPDLDKVNLEERVKPEECPVLSKYYDYEVAKDYNKKLLPTTLQPGYILFKFRHLEPTSREKKESIVSVAFVPTDDQLPMKLRFAYSVNLQSFVDKISFRTCEDVARIEVDSLDELVVKRVFIDLYPHLNHGGRNIDANPFRSTKDGQNLKFDKPSPKGRGPRRINK